jgi:adhesin/invasin
MVKAMFRYISFSVVLGLLTISCDKVPLLAPTNSTITVEADSRVVATGGTTQVRAIVLESSGTPVHNGTSVRFSTNLGRMEPAEAQTHNGVAVATFIAGNDSGIAEVRGTSGGAGTTTPTTPSNPTNPPTTPTTTTSSNVVLIAVGSGAVDTVTLRANPATVSTNGGTVTLTATVVAAGGRLLANIPVSFTATRGTLSSTVAMTDAQGEARVTLTTNGDTDVTAAAGTKTATAKVTGQPGPSVTLTCAVGSVMNCASVTVGATVTFTASRATGSGNLVSSTLDFGDGTSVSLGSLSSATNVAHAYTQPGTYTARLTGTDANGETATSTQIIQVNAGVGVSLTLTASGLTVTAVANVTGGVATQYAWTFEGTSTNRITAENSTQWTYTSTGPKTVIVTVSLSDGTTRTVSGTITL